MTIRNDDEFTVSVWSCYGKSVIKTSKEIGGVYFDCFISRERAGGCGNVLVFYGAHGRLPNKEECTALEYET